VFVGTTNETQYLRDSTGARRFWPLEARRINLGWLEGVRAQLFAEAVHAYDSGSAWHVLPAEAAASEAEARRVHDAIEDRIAEYLEGKAMVSLNEVWGDCLGAAAKDFDRAAQWRLSHALRALRWVNKVEKVNGKAVRVWRPIDAPF
jgi:putative DNA primase/helicase